MINLTLDFTSSRVAKAKIRKSINRSVRVSLTIFSLILFLVGALILFVNNPVGWVFVGLAVAPAMIVEWWNRELKNLAISKKAEHISDVLDASILAELKEHTTSTELVNATIQSSGALFFGARFGITPRVLQDLAEEESMSASKIFETALKLRDFASINQLTPGMIACSVVLCSIHRSSLLAHLHLEDDDLRAGILWQEQLNSLIQKTKQKRRTGGIARDWSFGYTPLLARFGRNVSQQIERSGGIFNVEIDAHQKAIDQIIQAFGNGDQNVTLVGSTGVGKTMLVEALAEKLLDASVNLPANLRFRQIIMLDAASMISAASGRGEIEQLTMEVLGEAFAAKNIIVCLDNAELFFEDAVGSVDITNILLPILEAGNLRMILTMDEQRLLRLSQRNPQVANSINRINIAPANEDETIQVMQNQLITSEFRQKVTYTYQSLREVYRLSSRYVHDVAMPGQAIKLLEAAAKYSESGLVTINSVQQAIEQTMDIKVSVASESEDREKLLNLEALIHKRMINQVRAVSVVSDALRRARAGVRNQDRPIGTFLFLGPTGVGKTELAKALADVYFGGEKRMIRLDLNEYVRQEDVSRLIADGASDASSLTAQAMKQPYSVILLDEIEKAHPSVLTTLLQLLDEGILRDINNREVSFRDAIVIATSNAGADRIREYIGRGYKLEQFEQQFTDELISSGQFKPEFLNRFDEIVTFAPLGKRELLQVVDLMLAGVNKTLAQQKVTVQVSDEAKIYLVEQGYDPRLGARPMRRVIQKAVENTVANQVLAGHVEAGGVVEISLGDVEKILVPKQQAAQIISDAAPQEVTKL